MPSPLPTKLERRKYGGKGEEGGGGNAKYIAEAMKDAFATAPQA